MVFMGKSLSFASIFVACDHIRNGVHDWAHYLSARMLLVVTMEKRGIQTRTSLDAAPRKVQECGGYLGRKRVANSFLSGPARYGQFAYPGYPG